MMMSEPIQSEEQNLGETVKELKAEIFDLGVSYKVNFF